MFLKFKTNEARRAYGGSDFVEMQYCKLSPDISEDEAVSVDEINNWDLSSLYVADYGKFYDEYKEILNNGIYNNLKQGTVDIYGINYYNAEKTEKIINILKSKKPTGYEIFLEWLNKNPYENGFYILGV